MPNIKLYKLPDSNERALFLHFSQEEALELVESLLHQANCNYPNEGRIEYLEQHLNRDSGIPKLGYMSLFVDPSPNKPDKSKTKW